MELTEPSSWAIERMGDAADDLRYAVTATARQAHERAVGSHEAQGYSDRDSYAKSLYVNLNRLLVDKIRDIPGVVARRPENTTSRFGLPFVTDTNVVLYWWRYGKDGHTRRENARLQVSGLREHLMAVAPTALEPQLTIDHADLSEEEIEQHFAEEKHFLTEMAKTGRTVTLGIASSPDGLFDFGWGDAELVDTKTGKVVWPHWESLVKVSVPAAGVPLRVVGDVDERTARFDDEVDETGFDLAPRNPATPASSEAEPEQPNTGSDDS